MPDKTLTVPVVEEEITVEKTDVSDGRVEVRTWTELEKDTLGFDLYASMSKSNASVWIKWSIPLHPSGRKGKRQ